MLHRLWITLPLVLGVLLWWEVFLVLVPRAYREQLAGSPPAAAPHGKGDPPVESRQE